MIDIKAPRAQLISALTRIAGVAGFVAIIGIGIWGSLAIAKNTPGAFSALASAITSFTSVFIPAGTESPAPAAPVIDEVPATAPVVTEPASPAPIVTPSPAPRAPSPSTAATYPVAGGAPAVSDPNGPTDLSVRILEQGVVSKDTGEFTASSSPNRADPMYRIAVRFAVENLGTRTSPQWTFNAVLPTYPGNIFSSPSQQALGPGDRIEFTLGFDSVIDADTGVLTVNVDPAGSINESTKANNIIHYTVTSVKK